MINLAFFLVWFLSDLTLVFGCWTNIADEWGRLACILQMKSRYLCNFCGGIKKYKRLQLISPYIENFFKFYHN